MSQPTNLHGKAGCRFVLIACLFFLAGSWQVAAQGARFDRAFAPQDGLVSQYEQPAREEICLNVNPGQGGHAYHPDPPGLETENCTDQSRLALSPGLQDYDVGFNSGGNWGNYTRTVPAGTYNIYMRGVDGISGVSDSASLSVVTSGQATTNQTTTKLGTFSVPATGNWQTYARVRLKDTGGNLVQITNNGAITTLRVTTDSGNYNAKFYILIPAYAPPASTTLTVSYGTGSGNLSIFFTTQPGYDYQLEFKTNLTDAVWIPLGSTTQSAKDAIGNNSRFYRMQIQLT